MPQTRLTVANLLAAHGLRLQRLTVDSVCDGGRWQDRYTVRYADHDGRAGCLRGPWETIQRQLDHPPRRGPARPPVPLRPDDPAAGAPPARIA